MKIRVNKKENVYFFIKSLFTILIIYGLVKFFSFLGKDVTSTQNVLTTLLPIIIYILIILFYYFIRKVIIVGNLKGNGVEITEEQFPEVYNIYCNMAKELELKKIPPLFVLQENGVLNAFAIRLSCKNYIAIYSDIFEMIENDVEVVKFILGHELGHVKRNHMSKQFWTFPASIIPFLNHAYSRSCEYTCDNIGNDLSENGSEKGLLVLAAGKKLYTRVNVENYLYSPSKERKGAVKFAELFASHPFLPNRIKNIQNSKE